MKSKDMKIKIAPEFKTQMAKEFNMSITKNNFKTFFCPMIECFTSYQIYEFKKQSQ
jgi:hypothetical protein